MLPPFKIISLALLFCLVITGCKPGFKLTDEETGSGDYEGVNGSTGTRTFFGPGSNWELILDDSDDSFILRRRNTPTAEVSLILDGKQVELDNGFLQLSVDLKSGADSNSFTYVDDIAVLEITDDTLALTDPEEGGDQLLIMVTADQCPTTNIRGNWITYKQSSDDSPARSSSSYFGDYQYSYATSTGFTSYQFNLEDNFVIQDGKTFNGADCGRGLSLGTNHHQYLNAPDSAIIHALDSEGGNANSFKVVLESRKIVNRQDIAGDYIGLLYDGAKTAGSRVEPTKVDCDDLGQCTFTLMEDFVADTSSDNSYSLDLSGTPDATIDGFITGHIIQESEATPNVACMANIDLRESGEKLLACVGQAPGASTKIFNVFAISR